MCHHLQFFTRVFPYLSGMEIHPPSRVDTVGPCGVVGHLVCLLSCLPSLVLAYP